MPAFPLGRETWKGHQVRDEQRAFVLNLQDSLWEEGVVRMQQDYKKTLL